MQKNDVYQQFIADVPDAIKKRFNQKKQGELVLHFQTNMIGTFGTFLTCIIKWHRIFLLTPILKKF